MARAHQKPPGGAEDHQVGVPPRTRGARRRRHPSRSRRAPRPPRRRAPRAAPHPRLPHPAARRAPRRLRQLRRPAIRLPFLPRPPLPTLRRTRPGPLGGCPGTSPPPRDVLPPRLHRPSVPATFLPFASSETNPRLAVRRRGRDNPRPLSLLRLHPRHPGRPSHLVPAARVPPAHPLPCHRRRPRRRRRLGAPYALFFR
jgi:hypothetical protein